MRFQLDNIKMRSLYISFNAVTIAIVIGVLQQSQQLISCKISKCGSGKKIGTGQSNEI